MYIYIYNNMYIYIYIIYIYIYIYVHNIDYIVYISWIFESSTYRCQLWWWFHIWKNHWHALWQQSINLLMPNLWIQPCPCFGIGSVLDLQIVSFWDKTVAGPEPFHLTIYWSFPGGLPIYWSTMWDIAHSPHSIFDKTYSIIWVIRPLSKSG